MATLSEYFSGDFQRYFACQATYDLLSQDSVPSGHVLVQRLLDLVQETQFTAFFVVATKPMFYAFLHEHLLKISQSSFVSGCKNVRIGLGVSIPNGSNIEIENTNAGAKITYLGRPAESYTISRKVYVYWDQDLDSNEEAEIVEACNKAGILITIRTSRYAMEQDKSVAPMAFISHDSRDKLIVKGIALELSSRLIPVWYDEFSLKPGDQLRQSIETGLKNCPVCIIFLSKNFLANEGWTKFEFETAFQLELHDKKSRFLPVWYDVTKEELIDYSPSLLNRVGLIWSKPNALNELAAAVLSIGSK